MTKKILVIAAHADDEVIGVGGTILKKTKSGNNVYLCIVTMVSPPEYNEERIKLEREQTLKVSRLLGIKDIFFCDLPAIKLDTISQKELNKAIFDCVNKFKPQIIYTHHKGDVNKDHRLIFESTMVVARPKPDSFIKRILSYECISSTEWNSPVVENFFMPNVYEDITSYLEKKLDVMEMYSTEIQKYPHPRSSEGLRIHAKNRGLEVGVEAAEAFMLIREIND